mgnify:CR=1 FL=1
MVKGLDKFREYFSGYTDQYVLIGGAACDISFCEHDADFRATRDLDIVLIVEAQTKEFGEKIWEFIKDGKYTNRAKSNGRPQFYRFEKPQEPGFPLMLELFARMDWILGNDSVLTPIYIDDSVSSLSAILLDDAYYETLLAGRDVVNGVSILRPAWLSPFKAKAWIDLNEKLKQGVHADSRDIKKHKNDILRIITEWNFEPVELLLAVKDDMRKFVSELQVSDVELKNLKILGIHESDIKQRLAEVYNI